MKERIAVIFDMDGVITDNNAYHKKAWRSFCEHYKVHLSDDEMHNYIFGRIARDTLEYIFKKSLSPGEVDHFVDEKELIYRKLYRSRIKPVNGLIEFLEDLRDHETAMALATSAPPGNVDFTFSYLPIKKYFSVVLNASQIKKGKPDPEIYIRTIKKLKIPANRCLVFEDSISGIKAAGEAGARVIGVATTHSPEALYGKVNHVIRDFKEMNFNKVFELIIE